MVPVKYKSWPLTTDKQSLATTLECFILHVCNTFFNNNSAYRNDLFTGPFDQMSCRWRKGVAFECIFCDI